MNKFVFGFLITVLYTLSKASGEYLREFEEIPHQINGVVTLDELDRILKRLDDSERLTERLLDRVEQLEARDRIQQEEIRNLKMMIHQYCENDDPPESQVHVKSREDHRDASTVHAIIETRRNETNEANSEATPSGENVRIQNFAQKHKIQQLFSAGHRVAFFAILSKHQEHIRVNGPIIFDNVTTNTANAYHINNGSFVAPYDGTYVLSATLMSHDETTGHFKFTKNGSPLTYMFLYGYTNGFSTASQTVILQLQPGDDISIQNINANKTVNGYGYTIFSGFLLYAGSETGMFS